MAKPFGKIPIILRLFKPHAATSTFVLMDVTQISICELITLNRTNLIVGTSDALTVVSFSAVTTMKKTHEIRERYELKHQRLAEHQRKKEALKYRRQKERDRRPREGRKRAV